MFKMKFWTVKVKTEALVKSSTFAEKLNLVKASAMSILIGLLVGVLFVFCNGQNGFEFIWIALSRSLTTNIDRTLVYFGCYTLIGLGLALGFKLKIFNMGGSGQILAGLIMTFVITNTLGQKANPDAQAVLDLKFAPLVFLVTIISGMTISTITGALKVYLNVHEVASSILLNWTLWYLLKWYMTINNSASSTPALNENMAMLGNSIWALCVLCALFCVVITYIVIQYTTTGYRLKIVGNSPSAAKYSGIKSPNYILLVMAVQGMFISMGGFFYYFLIQGSVGFGKDLVPQVGFDGIPVALVAFNNVLGIVPVAFLWGILKEGASVAITTPGLNSLNAEVADLVFGIIIYCSTLYVLFVKFDLILKVKQMIYLEKDIITKDEISLRKTKISETKMLLKQVNELEELVKIKEQISALSSEQKEEIQKLSAAYTEIKTFHVRKHKKTIEDLKLEIKDLIEKGYETYNQKSIKGLKISFNNKKAGSEFSTLDLIIENISRVGDFNKECNIKIKEIKKQLAEEIKEAKLSKDESALIKIEELKIKAQNDIQKIQTEFKEFKSEIENQSNDLIDKTNSDVKGYKEVYVECKKEAQTFLKEVKTTLKNNLKDKDENESSIIKKDYFEKLMEVKEKYDRIH
ncbi:ABC transporter permease [Spiroplasma endosymbiont of Diplazon laetatorius]|uniref:ABC transporter permease n=1 Tax=Spiroplasma endosymbiont of Diplazon laetatorius TaxID=3066322 RepID=UPI0030D098F9